MNLIATSKLKNTDLFETFWHVNGQDSRGREGHAAKENL